MVHATWPDRIQPAQGCVPAIILCAGSNGLGAARSLHKAGIPTIALALSPEEPALWSRLPARRILVTPQPDLTVAVLRALRALRGCRAVIVPTSDKYVSLLVRYRQDLEHDFHLAVPSGEIAELLIDKSRETRIMAECGVPLPRTVQELPVQPEALVEQLSLPLIIKPRSFEHSRYLGRKNIVVRTLAELAAFYARHGDQRWRFLAQEVIPGGDDALWVCNCTFNRRSELVAAFVFRRLRTSPAHFGVTSYAVSQSNPEVVRRVALIGVRLGYTGPAMVEFKYDFRDGEYKYLELNPRVGICNWFDTLCGVNNVFAGYQVARGMEVVPTALRQRDGVMYLSFFEDSYARLKDGERPLGILRHYWANAGRRHAFAYFTWTDPLPCLVAGLRDARQVCRGLIRKIMRVTPAGVTAREALA